MEEGIFLEKAFYRHSPNIAVRLINDMPYGCAHFDIHVFDEIVVHRSVEEYCPLEVTEIHAHGAVVAPFVEFADYPRGSALFTFSVKQVS